MTTIRQPNTIRYCPSKHHDPEAERFGDTRAPGRPVAIKKPKFTEQQIAFNLKQSAAGVTADEVGWKMGISHAIEANTHA